MDQDRKFFFDVNIFDAPEKEVEAPDAPPPPPVYSEDDIAAARDMAFEQGRQQGERDERQSRDGEVARALGEIAQNFSRLFAAETVRESLFEKESLRLAIQSLDLIFPLLSDKLGREEVRAVIEKTLLSHRKKKEINIRVTPGMKGEIDALISRIRSNEHEDVLWKVIEDAALGPGDCALDWGDGGAIRDSARTAQDIRRALETALAEPVPVLADIGDSEAGLSDILSLEKSESPVPVEKSDE